MPEFGLPVWGAAKGIEPIIVVRDDDTDGWLWGIVEAHWWYKKDGWQCDFEVDDDYGFITHWMPLPEPPK